MADISIQFIATPEEIRDFAKQAVSEFGLYLIEIRYPPYEVVELNPARLDEPWSYSSPFNELAFTIRRPNVLAKGNLELADKNPDILRLQIGGRSEKGLIESHLSARTDDKAALVVWKKIAKRLKGITQKGMTGFDLKSGASGPIPWLRYTAGAKALESGGVPLLTITGTVLKTD